MNQNQPQIQTMMQQHNQHMGDELSQSNTVTHTLESTQTIGNES
jgi:hypothetical protein